MLFQHHLATAVPNVVQRRFRLHSNAMAHMVRVAAHCKGWEPESFWRPGGMRPTCKRCEACCTRTTHIVSCSSLSLQKMVTVFVRVCEALGLTVSAAKMEAMPLQPKGTDKVKM